MGPGNVQEMETLNFEDTAKIRKRFTKIFELFDTYGSGEICLSDAADLIRSFGRFPSSQELSEYVFPLLQASPESQFISFGRLEMFMLELLKTDLLKPDSSEEIRSACQNLAVSSKDCLHLETLSELLKFNPKQWEVFKSHIYFDENVKVLNYNGYSLALKKEVKLLLKELDERV